MKKYIVEFTMLDGTKQEIEFLTDRIDWTIDQWCRNRAVAEHQILNEGSSNSKKMLFG